MLKIALSTYLLLGWIDLVFDRRSISAAGFLELSDHPGPLHHIVDEGLALNSRYVWGSKAAR